MLMILIYWFLRMPSAPCDWTQHNKMRINVTKTKELVFHSPHPTKFGMPYPLDGIVQERVVKLLGAFLSVNLSFNKDVNFVLTVCSQRIYLLKLLRSQNLPPKQLHTVFTALILSSRLACTLSVWGGRLTNHQRRRINAFFKRARKYGFTEQLYSIEDLLEKADARLFGRMQTQLNAFIPLYLIKICWGASHSPSEPTTQTASRLV